MAATVEAVLWHNAGPLATGVCRSLVGVPETVHSSPVEYDWHQVDQRKAQGRDHVVVIKILSQHRTQGSSSSLVAC